MSAPRDATAHAGGNTSTAFRNAEQMSTINTYIAPGPSRIPSPDAPQELSLAIALYLLLVLHDSHGHIRRRCLHIDGRATVTVSGQTPISHHLSKASAEFPHQILQHDWRRLAEHAVAVVEATMRCVIVVENYRYVLLDRRGSATASRAEIQPM